MSMTEQEKTRRAASQVDAMIGFWIHFTIYVLVNALLLGINYRSGGEWWAQWPALGWGIGVIGHAIGVFGMFGSSRPSRLTAWRMRKIEKVRSSM